MQKYFYLVLFLAMFSFVQLAGEEIPTDPPPCQIENCNPNDWKLVDYYYTQFVNCPDCTIHVWVKYNEDCNTLYLLYYQMTNMACTDCFINGFWTWADVNREIIKKLIIAGPLAPGYPIGKTTIRVWETACWKEGESLANPWEFQPCMSNSCCSSTFEVFKVDEEATPFYSFKGGELIGEECDDEDGCFSICSNEMWFPTIILSNIIDKNKLEEIKVYPNPTSNLITIEIIGEIFGDFEIIFYNNIGNKVYYKKFSKNFDICSIQLDLKNLVSGDYYFEIKSANKKIKIGKIIILK